MLLENTDRGLYCRAGDFFVDPLRPVDFAILTHAHSDHARLGSQVYLVAQSGEPLFRERLGPESRIQSIPFGKTLTRNGVQISLHPAGHILGSAQVRMEFRGEVCVVSGDYKLEPDLTCEPFEPIRCHTFVTESTFGLPIYRWCPPSRVFEEINAWWRRNVSQNRTSVLFAYALGKAQRLMTAVDSQIGPILVHGSAGRFLDTYRAAGIPIPQILTNAPESVRLAKGRGLVIAPPSANHSPWMRKFGECSTAFASGWMQVRGTRRRRALDRGFVLSDHADWPGLLKAIDATQAENVWVTHGFTNQLVRWLRENGKNAEAIPTRFETGTEAEGTPDADFAETR